MALCSVISATGTATTLNTPIVTFPSAAGTYAYTVTGTEAGTGCQVVSTVNVAMLIDSTAA